MDALVAEKVMRWKPKGNGWLDGNSIRTIEPTSFGSFQPSTDIAAAWEVVGKLLDNAGIDVTIYNTLFSEWAVDIANDGNIIATTICKSAPEAICKAALIAIMVKR